MHTKKILYRIGLYEEQTKDFVRSLEDTEQNQKYIKMATGQLQAILDNMPPLSTTSTLLELLGYPDQNIYRHAIAILKHINKINLDEINKRKVRAMNTASDSPR